MARIKVTGYLDSEDLDPEHVDLSHESGLSSAGFDYYSTRLFMSLDDLEFELEDGEE